MSTMFAAVAACARPVVRPQWSDRGATAVEYAIMVSLIAGAIIVTVGVLGVSVTGLFQSFLTAMGWS